jgi:dTDP-4-dehydrorhamnose 3,5-epimerase-like enzyme
MDQPIKTEIIRRKRIADKRGWFLKVITGDEKNNPFPCEVYLTSAKPGENKGGHYHKKAHEWFTLLTGKARMELVDIASEEKTSLELSPDKNETIYVPPMMAHRFVNTGTDDFLLLAYTDQQYDPADTIPFSFDENKT